MFIDTSVIVEIFRNEKGEKRFQDIYKHIKDEPLFISVIQMGELSDWCINNDVDVLEHLNALKEILNIIPLSEKICLDGSEIKRDMREKGISKFSLLDGIILASARSINQKLLTTDTDFRKCDDVIIIK